MILLMAISVAARAGAGIDERLAQPQWQELRVKADSLVNFFLTSSSHTPKFASE